MDAKFRGRPIDLNDVESFLGFVRDVGAHTGMMIALEGYTAAAYNRAYFDDLDVILDVLNFADLKYFQGEAAIPYSGRHGVNIAAPLGWAVDGTQRKGMLATIYQRGLTFEEAVERMEWMYVNFVEKREELPDLESVVKYQEGYLSKGLPDRKIEYDEGIQHQTSGARTLIRRLGANADGIVEITGFVDFPEFVFLCVLITPTQCIPANMRKLRFVMRGAFQMSIIQPSDT